MPLQTFQTLALGAREWENFLSWCGRFLKSSDPLELFLELPLFLMHAIRHYGDLQFQKGGSLSYYRHLILESIRRVPSSKQYASIAWDFASRWHKAEPTVHRVPIPLPLLKSLVSLSWLLGWKRWAGVTALAFFGLGRLGEVIRCQRRHLLLPRDSLNLESHDIFLVLNTSKTSFRNAARVQHMKVDDPIAIGILDKAFAELDFEEFLFPGDASYYRRRWNFLLAQLRIPDEAHLTPRGLRGGRAVSQYRAGVSLSSLLWKMRLKQQSTLESYLQEVAAMSLLTDLTPQSRRSIKSASSLFEFLATR